MKSLTKIGDRLLFVDANLVYVVRGYSKSKMPAAIGGHSKKYKHSFMDIECISGRPPFAVMKDNWFEQDINMCLNRNSIINLSDMERKLKFLQDL
jgi:hypothetical protein